MSRELNIFLPLFGEINVSRSMALLILVNRPVGVYNPILHTREYRLYSGKYTSVQRIGCYSNLMI